MRLLKSCATAVNGWRDVGAAWVLLAMVLVAMWSGLALRPVYPPPLDHGNFLASRGTDLSLLE